MDSSKKMDLYQIVTDTIIASLSKGIVPWQKPWNEFGMPINLLSKRFYRGINLWLLSLLPYERPYFLTWDQIKNLGGSVNKDEHGHIIVYWKPPQKKEGEASDEKVKNLPVLRYYKVFNIAQCRDIPEHVLPVVSTEVIEPNVRCESLLNNIRDMPHISFKGKQAYYDSDGDEIVLPKAKDFKTSSGYYGTLFHELVHSTGAEKRLQRKSIIDRVPFGTPAYATEELIAEMGAAYLCGITGILPNEITNMVSYLENWLEIFKGDTRILITAAGHAQRAVDYILNTKANDRAEELESTEEKMVS